MAERVRIFLAGQLGIGVGDVVADGAALGPLGSLALAFLVSERHRPVPRDELAEVLWGEDLPPTWEASLRSVVSRVRRRLDAGGATSAVITGGGGCYQLRLPPGSVIDVEEAAQRLEQAQVLLAGGDWQSARDLARAAADVAGRRFLPGLTGLWVEQRQAELDELRVRALEALAGAATAGGDHATAIAAAEGAVAAQPLRESAHVRLMAAHAGAGNTAEALRAYERCRVLLAEELGVSPSARTEAVYLDLLAGSESAPGSPPTNLRPELSSFVGRTDARRQVEKMLGTTRLVTLVGPGGVGKTRLAVRVGADVLEHYADGVWLVELAPLADGGLLAQHVVAALGIPDKAGSSPLESLHAHLAARRVLLVLDNCEHLSAACAGLVRNLLRACPDVAVLATSRERLGVSGESLWPVPPLSVPADDGDSLWDSESVRLFVERASAVDPDFAPSADRAPAVADICRQLDGVPLAIELAAARARSLAVPEIAAKLHDRFRLLVGRDPTAPDRHQTLRAAVDWSYDALAPAERTLFDRLSVFAGGFTLEAAEAVADVDVLDGLATLVDKSLVRADRSGPTARYDLLETLRQYGAERLVASGDEEAARARHLAWVRSLAEAAEAELSGPHQQEWLRRLDPESDNIRVALDWATANPVGEDGVRAAGALWRYWQVRARMSEGAHRLLNLIDVSSAPGPVMAKAFTSAAILLLSRSGARLEQDEADTIRGLLERSLAIRRATGDTPGIAAVLHGLGGMHFRQGDLDAARSCFEEALALGQEFDEPRLVAASLTNLGNIAMRAISLGKAPPEGLDAQSLYEQALAVWRNVGDDYAMSQVLGDLASMALRTNRHADAAAALAERVDLARRLGDPRGLAESTTQLGALAQRGDDFPGARSWLEESLHAARTLGDQFLQARALCELADVHWVEGDHVEAGRLYQEAAALGRPLRIRTPLIEALNGMAGLALHRDDLPGARRLFEEAVAVARESFELPDAEPWSTCALAVVATAEGAHAEATDLCRTVVHIFATSDNRPHTMATVLDVLATRAGDAGAWERVATLIGASDRLRSVTGMTFAPFRSRPEYQRAAGRAREELGDRAFTEALDAGGALPVDEVVALAQSLLQ